MTAVSDTEKAWMAGLWDGEGSCGVRAYKMPKTGVIAMAFNVQIHMADWHTIQRLSSLFNQMAVDTSIFEVAPRKATHRLSWKMDVRRIPCIAIAATALLPFSFTKRRQWEIMRDLCQLRMAKAWHEGKRLRGKQCVPWGADELQLAAEIRTLNRRGPALP